MPIYKVGYPGSRVEKEFITALAKLPRNDRELILRKLEFLQDNPKPQQFKVLVQPVLVHGYWAPFRLRIGDYRILHDIDEPARRVVILALRRPVPSRPIVSAL